jgi:glycosyltransferase involved in cell wall biosynthesis
MRAIMAKALAIIENSSFGKEKLTKLYQVDPNRIVVIPFYPYLIVDAGIKKLTVKNNKELLALYKISEKYLFYPAQFWPHKNHIYLLDALKILKEKHNICLDLVLCGSDKGFEDQVRKVAIKLGLGEQIKILGFIPDDHLIGLYLNAIALTFPTYFGPTNLPPLEAAALGCPVIYSDTPEFRKQMGDAALYCNLTHPESLSDCIYELLENPERVNSLKMAGFSLINSLNPNEDYKELKRVLDDFAFKFRY